ERGRGGVGHCGKHARLGLREPAAVKAGCVAEDDRSLRRREGHRAFSSLLCELVFGWIVVAERSPGPETVQVAPRSAARHVLERPGVLVNVDHVQERLEQMPVVEVSMPALRRFALVPRNGWCVP